MFHYFRHTLKAIVHRDLLPLGDVGHFVYTKNYIDGLQF